MDIERKKLLLEKLLPALCLAFCFEALGRKGYALREDIAEPLNTSISAGLARLRPGEALEFTTEASKIVTSILRGEGGGDDDPRQLLIASALLALKLVDEGLFPDVGHQSVLVSLLLVDEARNDEAGDWSYDRKRSEEAGGRMLSRARMLGLYQQGLHVHNV